MSKKLAVRSVQGSPQPNSTSSPAYTLGHPGPCENADKEINKTLKKSADHWLSADQKELKEIVENINNVQNALGQFDKKSFNWEKIARDNARRSLVAAKDIDKNEIFTSQNLTAKRPGTGKAKANEYFKYLGKIAKKKYRKDDMI